MPHPPHSNISPLLRRAFSLIELFVSVTIISILMVMLLPAVGMVRDAAKSTRCLASLRQLGMAGITYAGDWSGYHCPTNNWIAPSWMNNYGNWVAETQYFSQALAPYFADENADKFSSPTLSGSDYHGTVFKGCPSAAQQFRPFTYNGSNVPWQFGYGMNNRKTIDSTKSEDGYDDLWCYRGTQWTAASPTGWKWRYFRQTQVSFPANRIWIGDSQNYDLWSEYAGATSPQWDGVRCFGGSRSYTHWQVIPWSDLQASDHLASADPMRHQGRANYTFFDGHAASLTPRTFGIASNRPDLCETP